MIVDSPESPSCVIRPQQRGEVLVHDPGWRMNIRQGQDAIAFVDIEMRQDNSFVRKLRDVFSLSRIMQIGPSPSGCLTYSVAFWAYR